MARFDLPNLLYMFDESLRRLINHLETGHPDRALIRAKEMSKAVQKIMQHIGYTDEELINKL